MAEASLKSSCMMKCIWLWGGGRLFYGSTKPWVSPLIERLKRCFALVCVCVPAQSSDSSMQDLGDDDDAQEDEEDMSDE